MNTKNAKYNVVFGEISYDQKDNEIKMPPQKAHEKYIEYLENNFVELVVHKNTIEILKKLEQQNGKKGKGIDD